MNQITNEDVNKAIAEVLSRRVYMQNVSPEAISIETVVAGQYLKFHLRMSKDYKVLPPVDAVKSTYEQTGKQGEGAKYLMLGAVQIVGGKLRVTARIVAVETGVIKQAAKGDGDASYEGLCNAFNEAMRNFLIVYVA
jgi:hypothetical protein